MTRRPGLSLTEVLVAIFVMGIGCVAVLTLFPLGALNMAQAFRDDRTTQAASQAGGYLRWYVEEQRTQGQLGSEIFIKAMTSPDEVSKSFTIPGEGAGFIPAGSGMPSYPVVVDPFGVWAPPLPGITTARRWIGDDGFGNATYVPNGGSKTALARTSLSNLVAAKFSTLEQRKLAFRICSLFDGIGYNQNTAAPFVDPNTVTATSPGTLDRDVRYNWAWVVQHQGDPASANVTVVVYDKRAFEFAARGYETVHIPNAAQRGQSRISFARGTEPVVQKGGWLVDVTVTTLDYQNNVYIPPTAPPAPPKGSPQPRPGVRNAQFYRVVSVTDTGTDVEFELDSQLRADTGDDSDKSTGNTGLNVTNRRFAALAGVAEVFVLPTPMNVTP